MNNLLSKLLGLFVSKAVANSERLQTLIVTGALAVLANFGLPETVATPVAQSIGAVGAWLATLYTLRKPGAPTLQLPPPPSNPNSVPGDGAWKG